jgi:hypothetical protein
MLRVSENVFETFRSANKRFLESSLAADRAPEEGVEGDKRGRLRGSPPKRLLPEFACICGELGSLDESLSFEREARGWGAAEFIG